MASSHTSFNIRKGKEKVTIYWSSTPVNGENASQVTVYAKLYRPVAINSNSSTEATGSVVKPTTRNITVTVNGVKKTATRANWTGKGDTSEFGKFTFKVPHNSDGKKSVDISFHIELKLYLGGKYYEDFDATTTAKLDDLATRTTFTMNSTSITLGSPVEITLADNPTPDVRHQIVCKLNDKKSITILKKANDNGTTLKHTFTPQDIDFLENMPDKSINTTITVTTYPNKTSTKPLGTQSKTLTVNLRATDIPVLQDDFIKISPVPVEENTNDAIYIRGKSAIRAEITPTTIGSDISKYYYKINTTGDYKAMTSNVFDTHVIRAAGDVPVYFKVVDKRGMASAEIIKTIKVYDYYKPQITKLSIKRCDKNGTESKTGTCMKVTAVFDFPDCAGSNKLNITVQSKKKTETTYATLDTIADFNDRTTFTYTKVYSDKTYAVDTSYDFLITATDMFGYEAKALNDAFTQEVLVDMSQYGVAIGKISELGTETKGAFEVGWDAYLDDVTVNNLKASSITVGVDNGSQKEVSVVGHTHTKLVYDDGTDSDPHTVVQTQFSNLKFEGEDETTTTKDVYALLPHTDGSTIIGFTDKKFYSVNAYRGNIDTFYAKTARASSKITAPKADLTTVNATTLNLDGTELMHGRVTHKASSRYIRLTEAEFKGVTQYFILPDTTADANGNAGKLFRWNLGGEVHRFNWVFAQHADFLTDVTVGQACNVGSYLSVKERMYLQNNNGLRGMKKNKTAISYDDSNALCYISEDNRAIFGHNANSAPTDIRSPQGIYLKCNANTDDTSRETITFKVVDSSSDAGSTKYPFFMPGSNAIINLGGTNYKWDDVYCVKVNESSDRNLKKDIEDLDEKYIKIFDLINPVSYKFIDGKSGRTHTGFIAQDVEKAVEQVGLTTQDFAGVCKGEKVNHDEFGNALPILDEDGNKTYEYSLRYTEFIALHAAKIKQLEKRIEELTALVGK